jgi:hypothetical protein
MQHFKIGRSLLREIFLLLKGEKLIQTAFLAVADGSAFQVLLWIEL